MRPRPGSGDDQGHQSDPTADRKSSDLDELLILLDYFVDKRLKYWFGDLPQFVGKWAVGFNQRSDKRDARFPDVCQFSERV